jgi:hypothetical protein
LYLVDAAVVSSSNVVDQVASMQVVSLSPVVYSERYSDADRECLFEDWIFPSF